MTLQHTEESNRQSQEPALEARPADVPESEAYRTDLSATYSPDDNKLRLYAVHRLDRETYVRVTDAGFKWAPKQQLFVAPMWTPAREDLLMSLCGEIGDEDTTLAERQEERADRFGDYSENRQADASRARQAVDDICEHIPLGQPILVGHHSERAARRDQKRIESNMRKAVDFWKQSEYWQRRAVGARNHARYKERPDVRARRIKKIEADARKIERQVAESKKFLVLWQRSDLTEERAIAIAGMSSVYVTTSVDGQDTSCSIYRLLESKQWTVEQAAAKSVAVYSAHIARASRWTDHYAHRLAYERAMLEESGGLAADRFNITAGGAVLIDGTWLTVMRVNKRDGRISSIRTNARFAPVRGIEEVRDYMAPTGDTESAVKAANALGPIVNYPGEGFIEMTAAEFKAVNKDYKAVRRVAASASAGAHRYRSVMSGYKLARVYLTDAKTVHVPAAPEQPAVKLTCERVIEQAAVVQRPAVSPAGDFALLEQQLAAGVQVVTAPQLFPTPAHVAARMVSLANLQPGEVVLEPSAGTGALLDAIAGCGIQISMTSIEVNPGLAAALGKRYGGVVCGDFLETEPEQLGLVDVVLMNPPFAPNAADIKHIEHARRFLKPGGRLVAICAGGPRQAEKLRPLVEACGGLWEPLPVGTFTGTNVRTVLLTLN